MNEKDKLSQHLNLLREEYVKLQSKHQEITKKYNLLLANLGDKQEDTFVVKLLRTIANLFEQELYSDLNIRLRNGTIKAHKFILSSRSDDWGVLNLNEIYELDWQDIEHDVGYALLKWVYTDQVNLQNKSDQFVLGLLKASKKFRLEPLVEICEQNLITSVNVKNCVKFYQLADEIGVENLRNHCSELISSYWNDFTSDDFQHMTAPLLFQMFKSKTNFPLHTAIRIRREDVVFLFLIEFNSNLSAKVNEFDKQDDLPLDLALRSGQETVANNLLKHEANVNIQDSKGRTLLHRAVERHEKQSVAFLLTNGSTVDIPNAVSGETPLHLLCSQKASYNERLDEIARLLLDKGANPNLADQDGNACLHQTITYQNIDVFKVLIAHPNIQLDKQNRDGLSALAMCLLKFNASKTATIYRKLADLLVERGASVDLVNAKTKDTLLHLVARERNEEAGQYLIERNATIDQYNEQGEQPIHLAASNGLNRLVNLLLQKGANCNGTTLPNDDLFDGDSTADNAKAFNQTPLHLAIANRHEEVVKTILNFKQSTGSNDLASNIIPDLNIKNSRDQTPLLIALDSEQHSIAQTLIDEGANVNVVNSEGLTLLHQALIKKDMRSAMFLLNYGADIHMRTRENETPLQLAVKNQIESVVVEICSKGADVNVLDENGNTPLWMALESGNEDIASFLVQFKCDIDCWSAGPGNCQQTYLHKSLDENNEFIACFLIRSGCDLNSPRRPGPNGEGGEEAFDGQTPLHLACSWGLDQVVQTLLEFNADVNIQDAEGRTPLHIAIAEQHNLIIQLLLSNPFIKFDKKDKYGQTVFATAMSMKNNKAAEAILERDPTSAEKQDGKGRNFLHLAIQKGDIESVLFLLGIHVNVHSRVQDSLQYTPLHLAVESGNEMIVRNLLLAGANVNDLTIQKQTALHIAAEHDFHQICSILLENGIKFESVDININNALHIACHKGNYGTCKVLLGESEINAEAMNLKGQNPLHLLCQNGAETAESIFELFMSSMEKYPINKCDSEGNTPLLLAYMSGNFQLCKALVKEGVCLGTSNKQGVNIFNCQVASRNLLNKLLDYLPQEPIWSESDTCLECGLKFSLTVRKHHCRHCGRVLCNKCSSKETHITKFNLTKPVRVCELCYQVLELAFN